MEHMPLLDLAAADHVDTLDDHIEAHVHSRLHLDHDVEAVVLDPSYRGTDIEEAAHSLPFHVEWHHGFGLHIDDLTQHRDFHGAQVLRTGLAIAARAS